MMIVMMMMMMMMTITVSRRRCHRMKGSMAHQAATASYTTNAFMHTSMMMMMIQSWRRWRRWLPIIIQPGQILTVSEGCELGWGRRWVKMYITPSADLRIWGSEDLRIFPLQHAQKQSNSNTFTFLSSKDLSNFGNSFSHPTTVLPDWSSNITPWTQNQTWKWKWRLKTKLPPVFSVISPSRWPKT